MRRGWKFRFVSLIEAGTSGYPKPIRRRLTTVNLLAFLIFFASLNYAIVYAAFDFETYKLFVFLNAVLCLLALLVPLGHRINDVTGGVLLALFEYAGLFLLTALLGRNSGIQINYIIGAAVPFLCFDRSHIRLTVTVVVAGLLLHVMAWFAFPPEAALIRGEPLLMTNIYIFSAVTSFGLIAAVVSYAFWLKDQAEAKTEALLRNIFPEEVADRLREWPDETIARSYDEASVLFADLVGFTDLAKTAGPERTVALLNEIFSRFDKVADELGLEKIKTMGDAYMVAGGVPSPTPCSVHAVRVARMALVMRQIIANMAAQHGKKLSLRIGIACGPVLAGVIGQRKFSYDVWGDTVNLAARMESSSLPGQIHVTAQFARHVGSEFRCERRGMVQLRGFGEQETWFLKGPRPD